MEALKATSRDILDRENRFQNCVFNNDCFFKKINYVEKMHVYL